MTAGPSPGRAASHSDDLERALDSYAGFLAHQLAEVAVLLGGVPDAPPVVAARLRLDRMLADLRDLRPEPRLHAPVDLASLAGEIAAEFGEPGRLIRVRAADGLPAVAGDPALLRALLGHLMRTALASSPSGATLSLRAATRPDGRIEVQLEQPAEPAGVADAIRRMTPFERPTGSGPLLGAGVSGPAAARIVRAHGGVLSVRDAGDGVLTMFDLAAPGS